jgi:hypothetical protein
VVLSAVIDLFCMPNSLHADKDYEPRLILDIMPICHQQHAVLAFTLFYHAFFPAEFNIVVDLLNSIISDASLTSQKTVEFKDPLVQRSADDTKAAQRAYVAAEKDKKRINQANKKGRPKGRQQDAESEHESAAAGVGGNNAPATSAVRKTMWDAVRDVTGGAIAPQNENGGEGSSKPAAPAAPAAVAPAAVNGVNLNELQQQQLAVQTEASGFYYVCFNDCSVRNLAYRLSTEANNPKSDGPNIYITMIPSVPAITSVLEFFSRVKVKSTYFVNRNNSIVPDSAREKVSMLGVILHGANIYVNYTLLKDDKTFKQLWKLALEESMNRNTLQQKMLVGVAHENYPFYLQSVMFNKNKRPAIIKNPHFISPVTQLISYGTLDNSKLQECHRQEYLSQKHDIDMSCILQAASKYPDYIERIDVSGSDSTAEQLYLYMTSPSLRFFDMLEASNIEGKAIRYPEDCIQINNQQRLRSADANKDMFIREVERDNEEHNPPAQNGLDDLANTVDDWVQQTAVNKEGALKKPGMFAFGNNPDPAPRVNVSPDYSVHDAGSDRDNYPQFADDNIQVEEMSDF